MKNYNAFVLRVEKLFFLKKELYVGVSMYVCVYRGQFQISQRSPGAGIIYDCDVYDICDGKQTQAL